MQNSISYVLINSFPKLTNLLYIFCSIFSSLCLEEIYEDANIFGLKSANTKAVSNSWFAVTWLEATFPELANKSVVRDSLPGLRARPYAPLDASLMLQVI